MLWGESVRGAADMASSLGKYVISGSDYSSSDELGSGGYGAVYKGKHAEIGQLGGT